MLGPKQEAQAALFYEFSLEDHVPQDHLLLSIDRFVDLSSIRGHLTEFYSHTGRPSVDPELLIRMLLVGYCYGIRSERRLCEEVHLNLAYRWFFRLDLSDRVPDHSTFSKNRHGRLRESRISATPVRDDGRALHRGRSGQRSTHGNRCQPDRGRCQQAELYAEGRLGRGADRPG